MKSLNFLTKLKKEGKLELVDASDDIAESYAIKSKNCLLSTKILFERDLYENSVGEAYYSMYDIMLSLLFKCGIKCENHSAAVILLKELYSYNELSNILKKAKEERIDKQYYVVGKPTNPVNKDLAEDMVKNAEAFILELKVIISKLTEADIKQIRNKFEEDF